MILSSGMKNEKAQRTLFGKEAYKVTFRREGLLGVRKW
jgi:hypothetical protein